MFTAKEESDLISYLLSFALITCAGNWTFDKSSAYDFGKLLRYVHNISVGEFDPDILFEYMVVGKTQKNNEHHNQLKMSASMMIFSIFKCCHQGLVVFLGALITTSFIKKLFEGWACTHVVNKTNQVFLVHYARDLVLTCLLLPKCDIYFIQSWIDRMRPYHMPGMGVGCSTHTTNMCTIVLYSFISNGILGKPMNSATKELVFYAREYLGLYTNPIYTKHISQHLRDLKYTLMSLGYLSGAHTDTTGKTVAYNDGGNMVTNSDAYRF
ncbi:hypothetical protein EON65_34505 [archaeon]|nr:MAG: hypothetical protein EON65_34505 [archaeon]